MVGFPRTGTVAVLSFLFLAAALAGCGAGERSQAVPTSQASQITQASHATRASGTNQTIRDQFTRGNWAELVSDVEAHEGAGVDIVGRLLEPPERRDDGAYWQMYADPRNYRWNTSVHFADPSIAVAEGDFVHVTGTVKGALEGENTFGEKITLVAVLAETAQVVDVLAAATPAVRTAVVGRSVEQHGVVITIEKVEFAPDETRVFVKVSNHSPYTASFYDFYDAEVIQEGIRYEAESLWDYYPTVEWELLTGLASSGIIVFPALKASEGMELHLEARSDDQGSSFEPFIFEVAGG